MKQAFVAIILYVFLCAMPVGKVAEGTSVRYIASHAFSMDKRYSNAFVSGVFAKNILLTIAYARHIVAADKPINWKAVEQPFTWGFTLEPGEAVSYHEAVLPEFRGSRVFSPSHFNSAEGYVSDGYLVGDGTCQLASLMSWVARDSGLAVVAPTNHDFAAIPEVPKAYGVSIFSQPQSPGSSALQNLYIRNTFNRPVSFVFVYDGHTLNISSFEQL